MTQLPKEAYRRPTRDSAPHTPRGRVKDYLRHEAQPSTQVHVGVCHFMDWWARTMLAGAVKCDCGYFLGACVFLMADR
jgi:hypothetical protein